MNNILKVSLIVVVVLVVAGALFFAGSTFGSLVLRRTALAAPGAVPQRLATPGTGGTLPQQGGGPGNQNQGNQNDQGQGGRPNGQSGRGGPGQGRGGGPDSMFGGETNLTPVTADEAKKAAQDYITSLKIDGLEVGEVLTLDTYAYVAVKETGTGSGAFELMVDARDKAAHPIMGPASAWNLKYGGVLQASMMGGHMGRGGPQGQNNTGAATATLAPGATPANVSADMPLSQADAIKAAQTFLDTNYAGATASTTALKFYGYYSIDFSKDGKVVGKLSVNGFNGQVAGRAWRMFNH